MTPTRQVTSLVFGLLLAAAALKGVACSAIDPNPPDPHEQSDPLQTNNAPDASDASVKP